MERFLSIRLKDYKGVLAKSENAHRTSISIACVKEHKNEVIALIKEAIIMTILCQIKFEYLTKAMKNIRLNEESHEILLASLVAFDRETESEMVDKSLKLGEQIALDGLFNFRLNELKKRWDDIALLARNNATYLNNDEALCELLRFLLSAISPKIMRLDISEGGKGGDKGQYFVKGDYQGGGFEYKINCANQLLLYLINVAPLELNLHGKFSDKKLLNRLTNIFETSVV
ncbi:MAG: hypothetical protein FWC11_01315 [Firmicutes bacterium]|nr:hypothetical protein [Bacillota bacterium]MCL2255480.1 hypothetical protein [Bacillota bacterium]